MPDDTPRYFIRFSKKEDIDKIVDYYDENAHKNVYKRDYGVLKSLAEDGAIILIEDDKGKIVGSSASIPHKTTDSDGQEHIKWQEIGALRITLNGYPGLFNALIGIQTLKTFLVEPPEDRFVAQMDTKPVQGMAGQLGWRPFTAPEALKDSKVKSVDGGHVSEESRSKNWFHWGVEAAPMLARWMVDVIDNPVLENKHTHEKIVLDFSKLKLMTYFEPEIRNLAQKDFGSVEAPDLNRGLEKVRTRWMKDFFR